MSISTGCGTVAISPQSTSASRRTDRYSAWHDIGHPDRVHQAVLSGLLSNISRRDDRRPQRDRRTRVEYQGARGARLRLFPVCDRSTGSEWVVAAEVVETDRLRARRVSAIQPEWIEPIGRLGHRSYGEPEWNQHLVER